MENKPLKDMTDEELVSELFRRWMPEHALEIRGGTFHGGDYRCDATMFIVRRDPSKMVIIRD